MTVCKHDWQRSIHTLVLHQNLPVILAVGAKHLRRFAVWRFVSFNPLLIYLAELNESIYVAGHG